jgi:HEAT repeat protein
VSHERPDALLKSALEKIVYFEARAAQLSNDLAQAQAERDRVKGELAQASQREIELRRVIAELEVRTQRAHSEREEAATLAEALRRERAELLGKILDASRLNGETSDFDLASFIAELRSEVILRRGSTEAPAPVLVAAPLLTEAPAPAVEAKPSYITTQAQALEAQGRLTVSAAELASLERASPFAGRTEETLFGFSVRELSAPDASARVRAAERLTALGHPAAAPALATALHAETEGRVKVALLEALSHLAKSEAVPVVVPQLSAPSPEVRMTALKALLKLDATQAGPHLAAAVKDPDSAVRRRASLLALSLTGQAALELGEPAIRDVHPDVRSLAALVLGASGLESARPWLMTAMRDPEVRVRRSASQALSRLLGQDVSQLVDLDEAQRRREVRRLAQVPSNPVKAKLVAAVAKVSGPAAAHVHAEFTPVLTDVASPARTSAPPGLSAAASQGATTRAHESPAARITVAPPVVVSATATPSNEPAPTPRRTESDRAVPAPGAERQVALAPNHRTPQPGALAATRPTRVAVLEVDAAPAPDAALLDGVLTELRAAIRGQTVDALATSLHTSLDAARAACGELISQGQVVRRGLKYFVA